VHVRCVDLACNQWDKINTLFEVGISKKLMKLNIKLHNIRMRPQDSISNHISSLKDLISQLNSLKYTLSNIYFIDVILSRLHDGFRYCRKTINI